MTTSYEDTVFNFDLDLLQNQSSHQTPKCTDENEIAKQHKAHKAILFLKQNAISNDTLIRQCFQVKDMLHQKEKALFVTKQGYQEACIQSKNALDKCSRMEADAKILQIQDEEIRERYDHLQNQNGALQSHIKQLEAFIKQQELMKETRKPEKLLEKASTKSEINVFLQKQNKCLIQDICTLGKLFKKEKLSAKYKKLLRKYEKYFNRDDKDDEDKTDIYEDTLMSPSSIEDISDEKIPAFSIASPGEIVVNTTRKTCDEQFSQEDNDRFSDCSNEITSADTGRGSSLAFSDNEKCFHSPEYFPNDNHMGPETRNKTIRSGVDVATNTDKISERSDVATSPVDFAIHAPVDFAIPTIRIEKATPITKDFSTSPINFEVSNVSNRANNHNNSIELETTHATTEHNEQRNIDVHERNLEKECLEVNSSNYIEDECSRDDEIERILNTMRFSNRLITPIPETPSESSEPQILRVSVSCQTDAQFKCRCESVNVFHEKLMSHIRDFNLQIPKENNQIQGFVTNPKPKELNVTTHENTTRSFPLQPTVIEETPMFTVINVDREEVSLNSHEKNISEVAVNSENEIDNELSNINCEAQISEISTGAFLEEETMYISLDNEENEQHNSSVRSRLLFEPSVETNLDSEDNLNNSHSLELAHNQYDTDSEGLFANIKPKRKLTKLDRFRKKMAPKSKIKRENKRPIKKTRTSCKHLLRTKNQFIRNNRVPSLVNNKKVTANDSSASLNDKTVYEKAVRVMAELNKKVENIDFKGDLNTVEEKTYLKRKSQRSVKCENQSIEITDTSNLITTRSRSKCAEKTKIVEHILSNQIKTMNEEIKYGSSSQDKKRLKRAASNEKQEVQCKRILRSSTRLSINENDKTLKILSKPNDTEESCVSDDNNKGSSKKQSFDTKKKSEHNNSIRFNDDIHLPGDGVLANVDYRINGISSSKKQSLGIKMSSECNGTISYSDMDLFTDNPLDTQKKSEHKKHKSSHHDTHSTEHPKDSILCRMIEKYHTVIQSPKKIPDTITDEVCKTIGDSIKKIIDLPPEECKNGMNNLIELIRTWNVNNFLAGFMKYLQDPQRKIELYSKVNSPPAPPMTKSEKIILYLVTHLKQMWPTIDIVNYILEHIEYILFKINRTPEFDTIESMAHFYALICRYFDMRTRLRIFVLNAMYCIQFKAIALIKQTLDVWMHILPLGHMGAAKSPLVLCIVYLLHFYKCKDAFHRVQDIRSILHQKYSYKMSEWNETRILEMFRNAIKEVKVPRDMKVVRIALLVFAKRQGPRWCQKNIITNMLLPMIEKEDVRIKHFCVALLGPLMKPFPVHMKVHCEIVINQLLDMANQNPSQKMEEAIYTSLLYISKHNQNRVIRALLDWRPKQISLECEQTLCNFVREKPAHIWDRVLSKIPLHNTNLM